MRGTNKTDTHLLSPDIRFKSIMVAKLINYVMLNGKKTVATKIVYQALDNVGQATKQEPLEVLDTALKNASPILEVKGRRIGGANYQIPFEVPKVRRTTLAMKWMVASARAKQGKAMSVFLADEIIDAFRNVGAAIKKKEDMHRMAEANKAFAHFAKFS